MIIRRTESTVTVVCPYCGDEHEHFNSGINTAICLSGEYVAIEPHH